MANYERRRNQDWDWSDENNFRNRNSGYDRDYTNDRDFYNQYPRRDFNQDYENDRMNMRRGQSSNTDYDFQSDYGSSRGSGYGHDRDFGRDYGSSGQNYSDRGFRAGGNSDYYGRNSGSMSGPDYDRNYGNQGNFQGRNYGSSGDSDYDRDYGYRGQGRNSSGSWSGSDYGQGSGQGRNWGGNQGQNWGNRQGNFQSGQGEHYGRGPQGYKRSDDRIKEDINDRLTWHGNVDATNIQVTVKSGEVTLDGSVSDRNQKRMAEDVAEQVQGVTDVQNHLRVQNDDMSQSSSKRSGSTTSTSTQSGIGQVPNGKPKERANS